MRVMKSKTLFESFQENLKEYDKLKESSIYDKDFHDYSNVSNYELYDLADYYATKLRKSDKDKVLASEIHTTLDKIDKYAERGEGFNESRYKKLCSLIDAAKATLNESDEFESYDDFTDGDIVRDIIENYKKITGKDVKEIFNYEDRGNDSEGFFKEDVINETAVSIGEYLKEKGLSQNRIDEIYYKLDEVLSGMWYDYAPSDLNESFDLDDALADVTAWAECMYKGSEINSSTISSLLNSKEELKDKYTEKQKEKIVKWFEDEEEKYMPSEAINEGIALDSIKDIDNDVINQSPKLIQQAIDNSDLPEDKKMKLYNIINPLVNDEIEYDKEAKEKLVAVLEEADETVRVVTTDRDERDYAITDITELNEVADGDVQPPIDITGLLVEVDSKLTESFGNWGQINFQSTRFNVDTKDSNALFELRVGDKNYLMSMLLEENGSLLKVNNTDGKTIYKAKSRDVLSLAESYIKQFIPKPEEVPFCLTNMNMELHSKLDFLKAYIDLYKKAPKEDKEMLKGIITNDIYGFVAELSDEIKATEPTDEDKLELPTFDKMVEEVFGKEWVKEEPKENKLELDGVEQLKESEDNQLYVYSNAESEDKSDAVSWANVYRGEAPYLKFRVRKDSPMWFVDFIGKKEDIEKYIIKLGYYTKEELEKYDLIQQLDSLNESEKPYIKRKDGSETLTKEEVKDKWKEAMEDGGWTEEEYPFSKYIADIDETQEWELCEADELEQPEENVEVQETEDEVVDLKEPKPGLGTGYAQFYRKPKNITELEQGANAFTSGEASYIICDRVKLTKDEFDRMQDDFQAPNEYCKSFEPLDVENYSYNVIEFSCDGYDYKLLVDPSNHDNCRWVAKLGGNK